jgi:phospholipase/carboxylesterase
VATLTHPVHAPRMEALIVQRPAGPAQQLVMLFHGLGADEHDLGPVGERLAAEYPQALVVSLRAPEPCDYGFGYQWISPTALDDARRVERVAAALPHFIAGVRDWQRQAGLGPEATVLVGFSQGAMMALEAATQAGDKTLAGRVVALAGRFAQLPASAPAETTLFFVHGKADAVVHYGFTVVAAQHLVDLGADVVADVIPFVGHEIDEEVLSVLVERLKSHVPRRHWEAAMRGAPPATGDTQ